MPKKKLFPHQKDMLAYCLENPQGQLWCEPRLGKTLVAILAMHKHRAYPLLIITLKTLAVVWRDEYVGVGIPQESITIFQGSKKQKEALKQKRHKILIVNYEALYDYDILNMQEWGGIILDESIRVSNPMARMTKYTLKHIKQYTETQVPILCLSGHPAPESEVQFATQYLVSRGEYMGYTSFSDYLWQNWKWNDFSHKFKPKQKSHLKEIKQYVSETSMCLTREQVGLGSIKFYESREVKFNKKQTEAMKDIFREKEAMQRLERHLGGQGVYGNAVKVVYENLVCAGIHPMSKEIISTDKIHYTLDYYVDTKDPLLVLGQFVSQLKLAQQLATDRKLKCGLIFGGTPEKERELLRHKFQNGEIDILFGQVRAVKMGLDFSRSSHTHYISNSYSLDDRLQSEDRTTHLMKKEPVIILDYSTISNTGDYCVDSDIVHRLREKKTISKSYLESIWRPKYASA